MIGWEYFARVMLAIASRPDVTVDDIAKIRARSLTIYRRTKEAIQPGDAAFVMLGHLENGMTVKAVLALTAKQIQAGVENAKARHGQSA